MTSGGMIYKDYRPNQREHLGRVLLQSPVFHLGVTELPLQHSEYMLDAAVNRGDLAVTTLLTATQSFLGARLERNTPQYTGSALRALELVVDVSCITEDGAVILAQNVRQLADIRGIGRRHRYGVHRATVHVRADRLSDNAVP